MSVVVDWDRGTIHAMLICSRGPPVQCVALAACPSDEREIYTRV